MSEDATSLSIELSNETQKNDSSRDVKNIQPRHKNIKD